jgi:hypothetical protein
MAFWKWPRRRVAAASTPTERRSAPRYATQVTACQIITLPSNVPIPVVLRDISLAGLGLASSQPLAKGTFLAVELRGTRSSVFRVRAQVVHATLQADGQWIVGCLLDRPLRSEELEAML